MATTKKKSAPSQTKPALMELFVDEVKDIYRAEKHLIKALPKMQKASTSEELANAFGEHLQVTKTQVSRLEQIFEPLGKKTQAKKCDAMEATVYHYKCFVTQLPLRIASDTIGIDNIMLSVDYPFSTNQMGVDFLN
jgi:hypothetical protein